MTVAYEYATVDRRLDENVGVPVAVHIADAQSGHVRIALEGRERLAPEAIPLVVVQIDAGIVDPDEVLFAVVVDVEPDELAFVRHLQTYRARDVVKVPVHVALE